MSVAADALQPRLLGALMLRRWPWWLALLLPWLVLRSLPGLLVCALFFGLDFWRLRQRAAQDWPRWLDAAVPELEDSSALLQQAESPLARLQQQRLLSRLAEVVDGEALTRVARMQLRFDWRWLALSLVAAGCLWFWPQRSSSMAPPAAEAAAVSNELTLHVTPPAYTGVAAFDTVPKALQVPEHSEIRWCLKAMPAPGAAIELSDGSRLPLDSRCASWQANEAMFWRWQGQRYTVLVTPDAAPRITIEAPDELIHILARDARSARIAVAVSDDYRLERASLHLTLARGSGENIRFSDRELPLPPSSDPRQRRWDKTWLLTDLGMEPGDELYFFVRASDNAAPRPHISASPTYTLRLPGPQAHETESSALPMLVKPETLRSQRQIIIDTEQLLSDMKGRPGVSAAQLRARSEAIAADQGQLRRRYGQFLGEESSLFGDEHGEEHGADEKQDVLHRFGHAHDQAENATLFDEATKKVLRRALSAMWDAEKALRAITPQPALPPEYRALEAIKQLQQADRIYLHRTAFAPPPIKEEKRMSGDVLGTAPYRREQAAAPDALPAALRELMAALEGDQPLPALWSRTAQDWIRERIRADEDRLSAQRALQDVVDGCGSCRPTLRAWLRTGITEAGVRLQAGQGTATPFSRAWQQRGER